MVATLAFGAALALLFSAVNALPVPFASTTVGLYSGPTPTPTANGGLQDIYIKLPTVTVTVTATPSAAGLPSFNADATQPLVNAQNQPSYTQPLINAQNQPSYAMPQPSYYNPAPAPEIKSGACSNDGDFFCVTDTSFQRCSMGLWSPVLPTVAGTSCTATFGGAANQNAPYGQAPVQSSAPSIYAAQGQVPYQSTALPYGGQGQQGQIYQSSALPYGGQGQPGQVYQSTILPSYAAPGQPSQVYPPSAIPTYGSQIPASALPFYGAQVPSGPDPAQSAPLPTYGGQAPSGTIQSSTLPVPTGQANVGPCANEGAFVCVTDTSFQQCASGQWSVVQSMAAGTSCSAILGGLAATTTAAIPNPTLYPTQSSLPQSSGQPSIPDGSTPNGAMPVPNYGFDPISNSNGMPTTESAGQPQAAQQQSPQAAEQQPAAQAPPTHQAADQSQPGQSANKGSQPYWSQHW